jgi:sRNA-binding carbon storage regulator CsrA
MQEHALGVGEELVIDGRIRLTLLGVETAEVLLGITAPEPNDVEGSEAHQRRSGLTLLSVRLPSEN